MSNEVIAVMVLAGIVVVFILLRHKAKPSNTSPVSGVSGVSSGETRPDFAILPDEVVQGVDDEGLPVGIRDGDPYIKPKVFEVGLMKTGCHTADACHNALVSSPGTGQSDSVCHPEALYPITGLDPRYGTPGECAYSQYIRSP